MADEKTSKGVVFTAVKERDSERDRYGPELMLEGKTETLSVVVWRRAAERLGIAVGETGRLTWEPLKPTTVLLVRDEGSYRYECAQCGACYSLGFSEGFKACNRCGTPFRGEVPWAEVAAQYRQEPK